MNITGPIWQQCHAQPDSVAVVADGQRTSHGQLQEKVWLVLARLHWADSGQNNRASASLEFPAAWMVVVMALAFVDAVISPFGNTPSQKGRRMLLLRHEGWFLIHESRPAWCGPALPGRCRP